MSEPCNSITDIEADVVVVGGGIAGCCAAIAAARLGIRAVLVQNRPVLGGNASSEIGLLMAGADRDFPHVRESGIVEEIDLLNRYHNHEVQWRNSISDATLENLVKEAGVGLYLNTHVHALEMRDEAIRFVTGAQQATERVFRFVAPLFVDATGDGTLVAMAGGGFMTGTEARDTFGESLAPETASDIKQGSTLMYRVKDLGRPAPFRRPDWACSFPSPDDLPVTIRDLDRPQLWIEYGAKLDTIGGADAIRDELLKILYGVWDHVKNHGDYGADNYVLSWVGAVPGKRESRRAIGDHVLTQNDVTDPPEIPDAVAYGGWPIDVHNAEGFYAKKRSWLNYTHLERVYPIPYRCYYSRDIPNLFLAGRIISASHVAHGSIRLIRTCGVGGQAVGTAAALCTKYGKTPRLVGRDHIGELQQTLLKHDCFIPGIRNEDPRDLARRARASASSEYRDPETGHVFAAGSVIEGLSRGRPGDENLWMSAPADADPEPWIALEWPEPVELNRLHLVFDTMVREQRFFDRPVLGPLPTCVRGGALEYRDDEGNWQVAARLEENVLRHRVLRFAPLRTTAVRFRVEQTHGDPQARIYELRAYFEPETPASGPATVTP